MYNRGYFLFTRCRSRRSSSMMLLVGLATLTVLYGRCDARCSSSSLPNICLYFSKSAKAPIPNRETILAVSSSSLFTLLFSSSTTSSVMVFFVYQSDGRADRHTFAFKLFPKYIFLCLSDLTVSQEKEARPPRHPPLVSSLSMVRSAWAAAVWREARGRAARRRFRAEGGCAFGNGLAMKI